MNWFPLSVYNGKGDVMEILPAWLIEEIRKLEELRREQERERHRPRVYIDPMPIITPRSTDQPDDHDVDGHKITVPLR